jgi:hypothetical protein
MEREGLRRRHLSVVLLVIILKCGLATAQFGELPPGQVSKTEQGLTSELILLMTFDPAAVKDQLPEGLRFRTLEKYAGRDQGVAEYLRTHRSSAGGRAVISRSCVPTVTRLTVVPRNSADAAGWPCGMCTLRAQGRATSALAAETCSPSEAGFRIQNWRDICGKRVFP